jgi:hypothetical protein
VTRDSLKSDHDGPSIGVAAWRWIVTACIVIAAGFAIHDSGFIHLGDPMTVHPHNLIVYRLDYIIEAAFVRIPMLLFALLATWRTRCRTIDRILTTALIGGSLDVFWQWYPVDGLAFYVPMILKYAGTSFGFMQFVRFASAFGSDDEQAGPLRRTRAGLYRFAPLFLALAGIGFAAQLIRIPPALNPLWEFISQNVHDPATTVTLLFDAYLIGTALAKVAMILGAVLGWANAREPARQAMKLVTVTFCLYALGTALHFLLRFIYPDDPPQLTYFDATASIALPIGLTTALTQRRFFDVEFVIDRALFAGILGVVLLFGYFLSEHFGLKIAELVSERFAPLVAATQIALHFFGLDSVAKPLLDIALGLLLFLIAHGLYTRSEPRVQKLLFPDRARRLEALRTFKDEVALISDVDTLERRLLGALERDASVAFAYVFTGRELRHEGRVIFEPTIPRHHDGPEPVAISSDDPAIGSLRSLRKRHIWLRDAGSSIPGVVVFPMPVGGELYGFLTCGPSRSQGYQKEELDELAGIARETGATLFALRRHAPVTRS